MEKPLSLIHDEGLLPIGVSFLAAHAGANFLSSAISEGIIG